MSLKKDVAWNFFGAGAPLLLAVVTIPYIMREAGAEKFGILTLVWVLIGYFSLFDFGLGRALTHRVARELSIGNDSEIPTLVKSGILFTLATGVIGGLLLVFCSYFLAFEWLKISLEISQEAMIALIVAAAGIPLTTIAAGQRGVLEAYQDFGSINSVRVFLGVANFGFPALSLMLFKHSLIAMVASIVFARMLSVFAFAALVNGRMNTGWWVTGVVSGSKIKGLLSFGAWMTISNIISPLMVAADKFIISSVLGAAVVVYYSVPSEMIQRILIVPGALATALFPRFVDLHHTDRVKAKLMYRKSLLYLVLVMALICAIVALASYKGLFLWLGADFADRAWLVVVILSLGIFFNGVAQLPFAHVQASGFVDLTAKAHIAEVVFYLPLMLFLTNMYGIIGAATAWSIRTMIDCLILLYFSSRILSR